MPNVKEVVEEGNLILVFGTFPEWVETSFLENVVASDEQIVISDVGQVKGRMSPSKVLLIHRKANLNQPLQIPHVPTFDRFHRCQVNDRVSPLVGDLAQLRYESPDVHNFGRVRLYVEVAVLKLPILLIVVLLLIIRFALLLRLLNIPELGHLCLKHGDHLAECNVIALSDGVEQLPSGVLDRYLE